MSQMIKANEFASDKNFDDITRFRDGGVKKKILRQGKGAKPTEFAECTIQYIGYFTSGKVWINTYRSYEKSETFQMKKKQVIYGWEIACASMRTGEKARFKVSSAYAYGGNGRAPDIPPETNLVFDIELVEWKSMRNRKDKFMDKTNQSYEELVAGAEKEKETGNDFFKAGEYHEAVERYGEALQYARFVYEPKLRHTTRPLMLACELNKAFCHLKLKNFRDAIKSCDEVIKMDPHEPKAYFRKAVAYRMMGQDAEAKKNILQAKRLEPSDAGIDRELTLIEWQWDQRRKKERRIFSSLFDEEKQKQLEAQAEAVLMAEEKPFEPSLSRPVRFKEDQARLTRSDHVSLPGEEAMLGKWGGPISADLPRGDFVKILKKEETDDDDETKMEQAVIEREDDMPPLEPLAAVVAPKERKKQIVEQKKPVVAPPVTRVVEAAKVTTKRTEAKPVAASPVDSDEIYVYDNSVTDASNPQVYFNFSINNRPSGKLIVELFANRVPKNVAIFRRFCEKQYAGTSMSRFIPNFILQGGQVGSAPYTHEDMSIPLDQEGLVCIAASGESEFFFTLVDCSHLNGHYQVVGKVIEGIELILEDIADIAVDANDVPSKAITIRSSGDFDFNE